MAEIQKTTNYNLLTPSEDDFFNVDHQNTNMEIIDAELKNLDDGKETLVKNAAVKGTIVDADSLPLSDSADSQKTKKIAFANLKTALKAYFDTLYNKYIHPEYTSRTSGLYKVTVDGTGHVSAAAAVAKSDITALGIPAQDTVTEIVDNLTSTDAAKALSAKQGKTLNDLVSSVSTNVGNLDATKIKLPSGTATLYGAQNVDEALMKSLNLASYMAFCGNVNSDMLDAAFGKNNEDRVHGIGLQLAMYAWFKGNNKITYPFNALLSCRTFQDCLNNANAFAEILDSITIRNLISASPYATAIFYSPEAIQKIKSSYTLLNKINQLPDMVNSIRNNPISYSAFKTGSDILATPGAGNYIVPPNITALLVCLAKGGNSGASGSKSSSGGGGSAGGLLTQVLSVQPGDIIPYVVGGRGENTSFGSLLCNFAGANGGGPQSGGATPSQSGLFIPVGNGGGAGSGGIPGGGGGGGYLIDAAIGLPATRGGVSSDYGYPGNGFGAGGGGGVPENKAGGAGAQGGIVIFHA